MDPWLAWRWVKLVALVLFAAGLAATLVRPDRPGRLRALHGLAVPGLVGLWVAGYAMAKATSASLGAPWIAFGMLGGLVALQGAVAHAHDDRPGTAAAVRAVAGLLASVGAMVVRPTSWATLAALTVPAVALAVPVARALVTAPAADDDDATRALAWRSFATLARLEGASAVLLILIATPLKYGAGVLLDGGTGLLGWTHGVLLIVYVLVLLSTARTLAWPRTRTLAAFLASLVPLGTFAFERTVARSPGTPGTRRAA